MKNHRTNQIEAQISLFRRGIPKYELCSAAKLDSGIKELTESKELAFEQDYKRSSQSVEKFVPASGSATRMFKDLLEAKTTGQSNTTSRIFHKNLIQLPFDLRGLNEQDVLVEMFDERKLDREPKGLLPFHYYKDGSRTALEEHMVEGINYCERNGRTKIHFTVSPEHIARFESLAKQTSEQLSSNIETSFSFQNPNTNTIVVDLNNDPVYDENNEMLFRPAGHGALLENLNNRESDLIFIKNIDNVVPDKLKKETIKFKKILAGILLNYQDKVFDLLRKNDQGKDISEEARKLLIKLGAKGNFSDINLIKKLNRPLRVCGMVKNVGEPGGGPFWVKGTEGTESLQIVESAQVDMDDPEQEIIFNQSTHFNPVDLVCGLKDFEGNKFNLFDFTDPNTSFITQKSYKGNPIKAMELPGLWNGAMAEWNTIFVEVPLITFNPVKTVIDLLKPEHQV